MNESGLLHCPCAQSTTDLAGLVYGLCETPSDVVPRARQGLLWGAVAVTLAPGTTVASRCNVALERSSGGAEHGTSVGSGVPAQSAWRGHCGARGSISILSGLSMTPAIAWSRCPLVPPVRLHPRRAAWPGGLVCPVIDIGCRESKPWPLWTSCERLG